MASNLKNANAPLERARILGRFFNALESLDIGAVFGLFTRESLRTILEHAGRYILFPAAVIFAWVQTGVAWYTAYKTKQSRHVVAAAVDTGITAVITGAVVSALLSAGAALVAPYIFTGALGVKTLFNMGASIYHLVKAVRATTSKEEKEHYQLAKEAAIGAFFGALATAAIVSVMVFGHFAIAALGITVGVLSGTYALVKGIQALRAHLTSPEREGYAVVDSEEPTENVPQNSNRVIGDGLNLNDPHQKEQAQERTHVKDLEQALISPPSEVSYFQSPVEEPTNTSPIHHSSKPVL